MSTEALIRRSDAMRAWLSPLDPYLNNDAVTEIMLNADGRIWVDEHGVGMYCTEATLTPESAYRIIGQIAAHMGQEIHQHKPVINGKLPIWGYRVQASVPPIVEQPVFSFRKPAKIVFSMQQCIAQGMINEATASFLENAVHSKNNILIGGSTSSGKTTFANTLLQCMSHTNDRLYIVEDTVELQSTAKNKVQILVIPQLYSWHDAMMEALRYRPDRIIVGEVRHGIAALEMLKIWNTGHAGGLSTIHADSALDMLDRLAELIGEVKPTSAVPLIARSIDLCIHLEKNTHVPAGRSISGIYKVNGFQDNNFSVEKMNLN